VSARSFAVIAALASGCGRLGFDAPVGSDSGAQPDACTGSCGSTFEPSAGGCTASDAGPFVQRGAFPTAGGGYGLWSAPPHLLAADTTGGLHSLRFDGSTFTELDHLTNLGWVEAVVSDGTYFYVGAPGTGLTVIALDTGTGQMTQLAQNTTTLAEARRGWFANGVMYVPSGGDGLFAIKFDGTAITQIGAAIASQSWSQGVWAKGARVFYADADKFRVVDFNGATFTDVIPPDARHSGTTRVWSDGTTIFVASADGATAYRVTGSTLTELDTFATAAAARDIWSDGQHIFVAAEADGLYALRFENDKFAMVDRIATGGTTLGVFGDGNFIYANDLAGGVRAYSGFACHSW
jgi:hypothetical protein